MSDLVVSARVGANVRRVRREQRMTLRRLGELLRAAGTDLSVSALSRLEKGERSVSVDQLYSLADALDRAPTELLEQETHVVGDGNLAAHYEAVPADVVTLRQAVEHQQAVADGAAPDRALMQAVADFAAAAHWRGLSHLLQAPVVLPETLRAIQAIAAEAAGAHAVSNATAQDVADPDA